VDATGTKHKDHTTGDHSHTTGTHTTGTHTTGDHSVDHPSHSKGPAALGGPSVTASTAPMHNTGTGHRDESKDPLTSSQLGVHSSEHSRAQGGTPLVAKPVGTDLGDKLHGTDRNRGAHSGDVGHHAGGEHSTHVGHGHTTGEHGTRNTSGHNPLTSGTTGSHEPSTHHIGGETSSHVGHGHTGHHTEHQVLLVPTSNLVSLVHTEHQVLPVLANNQDLQDPTINLVSPVTTVHQL